MSTDLETNSAIVRVLSDIQGLEEKDLLRAKYAIDKALLSAAMRTEAPSAAGSPDSATELETLVPRIPSDKAARWMKHPSFTNLITSVAEMIRPPTGGLGRKSRINAKIQALSLAVGATLPFLRGLHTVGNRVEATMDATAFDLLDWDSPNEGVGERCGETPTIPRPTRRTREEAKPPSEFTDSDEEILVFAGLRQPKAGGVALSGIARRTAEEVPPTPAKPLVGRWTKRKPSAPEVPP